MNYLVSVQAAIDFIEENIEEKIELEEVSKIASMSLPHLYRMFYSFTGYPVKDYMRKRRISIASDHLKYSHRPIIGIAIQVGFESQASFTKTFKKIVGITPKVYKESDMFFCFDRIDLYEKINYLESRELFDRYPDIKVIQLKDMAVLSYIHRSDRLEGIEKDALAAVQKLVQASDIKQKKMRIFGRNIEYEEAFDKISQPYAYEIMISVEDPVVYSIAGMSFKRIQGGMYAIGVTTSTNDSSILSLWNQMYSEWLPKSSFNEGTHTYLEEYIAFNEKLVRMKLYLPIKRQLKPEMISVEEKEPFRVGYSRIYGQGCQEKADKTLSEWLKSNPQIDHSSVKLYLSYSYDSENDLEHWSEYGITNYSSHEDINTQSMNQKILGGGLFAVMETRAYGTLAGVLEIIHRWIVSGETYILDDSRQWFAQYRSSDVSPSTNNMSVRIYIPILERNKMYG
ncbi:effector binding domain-containing protein [Bacillus infantis]|uniref:effector binding domain-containing protein n=1 Tax=Bacillus infantis TaxID=324767 RepID=UPI0021552440|nr:effector binding domain-containing protein [Bacillus infantis]MCR6609462.1 effector binding domain-containing protein [Bacillus infantis]